MLDGDAPGDVAALAAFYHQCGSLAVPNFLIDPSDVVAVRAITVRHPCLKTPSSTAPTVAQHCARFKADNGSRYTTRSKEPNRGTDLFSTLPADRKRFSALRCRQAL